MKSTALYLILATTFVVLMFSFRKETPSSVYVNNLNIYQEWVLNNGLSYKDGNISVRLTENKSVNGQLAWNEATVFEWKEKSYIKIPYKFNGNNKITTEENSVHSMSMVIRINTDEAWEAAIRTTRHAIPFKDEEGNERIKNIDIYQNLKGEIVNLWQKEDDKNEAQSLYTQHSSEETISRIVCTKETHKLMVTECKETVSPIQCTYAPIYIPVYTCITAAGSGENELPYPPGEEELVLSLDTWKETLIKSKPYLLFPHLACSFLESRIPQVYGTVTTAAMNKINNIISTVGGVYYLNTRGITEADRTTLENYTGAYSTIINTDFLGIKVNVLPFVNGQRDANRLMTLIRTNINSFVDPSIGVFAPFSIGSFNDNTLWNSNNPTNAIVTFKTPDIANYAFYIVNQSNASSFTLNTIHDPKYGKHPISGSRDIAYVRHNDNTYTFYTIGVDRLTNWREETLHYVSLNGASSFHSIHSDAIWSSFRANLFNYIISNGGQAELLTIEKYRPDWMLVKNIINEEKNGRDLLNFNCQP